MTGRSHHRVAIVGGGLSGLATAVQMQLHDPSLSPTVFEASERLGGVIRTEQQAGFLIDHGADMFSARPPATLELCKQIGLGDRLIEPEPTRRGARIVFRGRLVSVPEGFVVMRATQWRSMLSTPLLSWRGKLRMLAERWIPSRFGGDPERQRDEDESVGAFTERRMGREVLERMVGPLAAGIYTADVSRLSMQATMRNVAAMEREFGSLAKATAARRRSGEDAVERISTGARYGQFRALKGGMGELIEGLAQRLDDSQIQLQTKVHAIRPTDGQWQIETDQQTQTYDRVVVALPASPAARLLRSVAPSVASELASIESASTAIVVLGVNRSDIAADIETFGFVVPSVENRRILAGSFASHKFAGRAPEDAVLIRVFIGGALQSHLLEHDDESLIKIAQEELAELIGLGGSPRVARVVRWNEAMPQYHVGHCRKAESIDRQLAEIPGLFLASNALHGVGITTLVAQAKQVAEEVAASFPPLRDAAS